MWHIKSIYAKNLCSFLELQYAPKQGEATLIFGNNLDSDSQNSNGSGKSALIEAIAIALTGEPLRKVNVDEIINDTKDAAVVSLVLFNTTLGVQMSIKRMFSRKGPQLIQVLRQTGPYDCDTEEVHQATVADFNKYILDQLGLSKDDIFANFILTARKYKSFLASSDKEKKELINRFSNGVLVDESIDNLRADMEPVQEQLSQIEKTVAMYTGKVEALATEIENAINDSKERNATNKSRIQNWQNLIACKRAEIRTTNKNIDDIEASLDGLESLDDEMQKLEKDNPEINEALHIIEERFKANSVALTTDYAHEIEILHAQIKEAKRVAKEVSDAVASSRSALNKVEYDFEASSKSIQEQQTANEQNRTECAERIAKLTVSVKRLKAKSEKLSDSEVSTRRQVSSLKNQLAGVITCPKCQHEFVLESDMDIASARKDLKELEESLTNIAADIQKNDKEYQKVVTDGKNQREIETSLDNECRQLSRSLREAEDALVQARQRFEKQSKQVDEANNRLAELQSKLSHIRKRIFDDVFDTIDTVFKQRENRIKTLEEDIKTLEGSIDSYEQAIKEAEKASEEDVTISLKKSLEKYQKDLQDATAEKNEVEGKLNELKSQEATFIEFKTYLANTKINAIAQITNEFLETIGSDIRVALSGYTILKSGKVRDKISVSLLRNGIDCGSFEKFSAGERVRVELASILSMNQLTNMNCEDGKGLDLLIADEVLDSADEQGLSSVFKALNKTQITSLVVSHGNIQEGYPNKITIVKQNGVSSIYDTNQ